MEVGLWFRHGDFKRPLTAGVHWLFWPITFWRNRIERINIFSTKFEHVMLDLMLDNDRLRDMLTIVDLDDSQRALVWKDGRLGWMLGPGRHAFWKHPYTLTVEVFDVNEFVFEHSKIDAILGHNGGSQYLDGVRVEAHERVLLFREGELVKELGPGMYVFWKNAGKITHKSVDLREQVADVAGQEIMTADKVTLRVNLVVTYLVTDPQRAVTVVADHVQTLYREAQLVLREAVGGRALDKLLSDKDAVGREIREALASRVNEFGVVVQGVGLRDVILPGEMKEILNQVIEAQKQAEANLIRRREETAAARSQVNTAKLLAENPALARMKELEALQEILAGAKTTFVLGSGDMVDQVSGLIGANGRERHEGVDA